MVLVQKACHLVDPDLPHLKLRAFIALGNPNLLVGYLLPVVPQSNGSICMAGLGA